MTAPVRHGRRAPSARFLGRLSALARLEAQVEISPTASAFCLRWRVPLRYAEAALAIIGDPELCASSVILFVETAEPGSVRGLRPGESASWSLVGLLASLDGGEGER